MNRPDIAQIYTEYRPRVLGYIYARLRSVSEAEDLCEDVFEKIQLRLDSYDPGKAALGTWIYTITRNSVIDYYRKSRPSSELNESLADDTAVDDALLNDETLRELAEALLALPDQLRQIVVLRYYDEMPLTEIAKRLRLSYGATKLRHTKALNLLREHMK